MKMFSRLLQKIFTGLLPALLLLSASLDGQVSKKGLEKKPRDIRARIQEYVRQETEKQKPAPPAPRESSPAEMKRQLEDFLAKNPQAHRAPRSQEPAFSPEEIKKNLQRFAEQHPDRRQHATAVIPPQLTKKEIVNRQQNESNSGPINSANQLPEINRHISAEETDRHVRELIHQDYERRKSTLADPGVSIRRTSSVTGEIHGKKFNDLNGNGSKDESEPGLSSWTIYIENSFSGHTDSTVTDSLGLYAFTNLPLTFFYVREKSEESWKQTFPYGYHFVSLDTLNPVAQDIDFGNTLATASIRGLKFNDLNANGARDSLEPGLGGWTIVLYSPIAGTYTTTDSLGRYEFTDLPAGSYNVYEQQQTGWEQTYPAIPTYKLSIDTAGESLDGIDFGNLKGSAEIHGIKFNDLNGDGVKDAGEPGIPGWIISITYPFVATTTTDSSGEYRFANLTRGTYWVSERLEPGWQQTFPPSSSWYITVDTVGQLIADKDFGNRQLPTGSIYGMKFNDLNHNGVKDAGEPGIAHWGITYYQYGTGRTDTTETDSAGNYWFLNLAGNSEYLISEIDRPLWLRSYPSFGSWDIYLDTGAVRTDIDFGNREILPNTIQGMKFDDRNQSGSKDSMEPGIAGWRITLYSYGIDPPETTFTDSSGRYWFRDLPPGNYSVSEEIRPGWTQSFPPSSTYYFYLDEDSTVVNADFGNWSPEPGSVTGMKFHDLDGDGIKSPTEPGLQGWMIYIYGNNPGDFDSTLTDSAGRYRFMNLPGNSYYFVSEKSEPTWVRTYPDFGWNFYLGAGEAKDSVDFGNFRPGPASIHGMKFNDLNGNAKKDPGEGGLSGWTIYLYKSSEYSAEIVDSTLSDATGRYSFMGVMPGSYFLAEKRQSGWILTLPSSGYWAVTAQGRPIEDIDFGNWNPGPGEIHGSKFNDLNANGTWDSLEPGIAGWKIYLYFYSTQRLDSTVTNDSGAYLFMNLPAGDYLLVEEDREGWGPTLPFYNYYSARVRGNRIDSVNFGNTQNGLGSIHGMKFNDLNKNGVKDAGEPGLPGWEIYVCISSNGRTFNTRTDSLGNYSLMDMIPGDYTVCEAPRPGWQQTYPNAGSWNVSLNGENVQGKDFGNYQYLPGSIHGVKFNDLNGNARRDSLEPGIPGWIILLSSPSDFGSVDTAITDSTGSYSFINLPGNSFYSISEAQRFGWEQTYPGFQTWGVSLPAGGHLDTLNFGNKVIGLSAIHGMKFDDVDGNGRQDSSEPGLAGWSIEARNVTRDTTWTTLTDTSGQYWFTDLLPGNYIVTETEQEGWLQTYPTAGLWSAQLRGDTVRNFIFGNWQYKPGSIHGMKWHDRNGDGVRDTLEEGLSGWQITALSSRGDMYRTLTDTTGAYGFVNLPPATYRIQEDARPGWTQTGGQPYYAVRVGSGQAVNEINFGNFQAGAIYGVKFRDRDGNGVRDSVDRGIPDWTICLFPKQLPASIDVYRIVAGLEWIPPYYGHNDPIQMEGTLSERRGEYLDAVGAIPTEIVSLSLKSVRPLRIGSGFFDVFVEVHPDPVRGSSYGFIQGNGAAFPTQGFFDVFFDVVLRSHSSGERHLINHKPYRISAIVNQIPYGVGTHFSGESIALFGEGNNSPEQTLYGLDLDLVAPLSPDLPYCIKTDSGGVYRFTLPYPGTFSVREEPRAGWTQTTSNPAPIGLMSGSEISGINFGNQYLLSAIHGIKFSDVNGNCIRESGEPGLARWIIKLDPSGQYAVTNDHGEYSFTDLPPGTYTVREVSRPNWDQTCPGGDGTYMFSLAQGQEVFEANFGNRLSGGIQDLAVDLSAGRARPGFQKQYVIEYGNVGSVKVAGNLRFEIPAEVTYLNSEPAGVYADSIHTLSWDLGSISPETRGRLIVVVQVKPDVPIGTELTSSAVIGPLPGDIHLENNFARETQRVSGSFDPNDKAVAPEGFGTEHIVRVNDTLNYQIRFQNVGNDTAFNIVVSDPIDQNLDLSTLELGASSHPYSFSLEAGRELRWTFDNINLPDTFVNEPESQGFVWFKIRPVSGISLGTVVTNAAAVFFDFNAPVATNAVTSRIDTILSGVGPGVQKPLPRNFSLKQCFPNPFNPVTQIEYDVPVTAQVNLRVYNVLGQEIATLTNGVQGAGIYRFSFDASNLPSGVYFYKIEATGVGASRKTFVDVKKMALIR